MPPKLLAWMHPDDLALYQLDMLPWPVYLLLLQSFYSQSGWRVVPCSRQANYADFMLSASDEDDQLLCCCSLIASERVNVFYRVQSNMNRFHVKRAVLASPTDFSSAFTQKSRQLGIELLSAHRLRAKIERLLPESRRKVLDSIRSTGDWL